jgi:hypothetical protein
LTEEGPRKRKRANIPLLFFELTKEFVGWKERILTRI